MASIQGGILIGDSITKYVTSQRLGISQHVTFSWPGAKVEDLKRNFNNVIIQKKHLCYLAVHVGTNNLSTEEPSETSRQLMDLIDFLIDAVPDKCKILYSLILPRNDDYTLDRKRIQVNNRIRAFARRMPGRVVLINTECWFAKSSKRRQLSHRRGKEELYGRDGLHLSFGKGVAVYNSCFRSALKSNLLIPLDTVCPPTKAFVQQPRLQRRKCSVCRAEGHAEQACAI